MIESLKWLNIEGHVKIFSKNMLEQLHLEKEGHNLLIFQKNFKEIPNIKFPTPLMNLTSDEILVETYEEGVKMTDIVNKKNYPKETLDQIAKFGVVLYLKMIVDNFLHGGIFH
jgi:aarF domain-containing kinase